MSVIDKLHERFAVNDIYCRNGTRNPFEWEKFLNQLPKPKDVIEASYFKYECRKQYFPKWKLAVYNLVAVPLLTIGIIYSFFPRKRLDGNRENTAVFELHNQVGHKDVFPDELQRQYDKIITVENCKKKIGYIINEAKPYFYDCIKRYPKEPFFLYFVYKELIAHSYFLCEYNPTAVIVYVNERNVASPILHEIYKTNRRELISFMHGEYHWNLINAFMSFSKFYIWDMSYIRMFRDRLCCNIDEYIPYIPLKMRKKWNLEEVIPVFECTYYLGNNNFESIDKVIAILNELSSKGKKCKIRPHPRNFYDLKSIEDKLQDVIIENPNEITIKESLSNTKYAIGLMTTVLFEAVVEGREVILDDLSDPGLYNELKMFEHRIIGLSSKNLSQYILQLSKT